MKKILGWMLFLPGICLPLACTQTTFPTVPQFTSDQTTPIPNNGNYQTQWGSYGSGVTQFLLPGPLAAGGTDVFVQDNLNSGANPGVKVFDFNGNYLNQWVYPSSVTLNSTGYTMFPGPFTADNSNNLFMLANLSGSPNYYYALVEFNSSGSVLNAVGLQNPITFLGYWNSLTVDGSDNVFLCGYQHPGPCCPSIATYLVMELNSSLSPVTTWGSYGSGPGQMLNPIAVGVDSSDNAYVADSVSDRVQKFDPVGNFLQPFSSVGTQYGQLLTPLLMGMDGANEVFIYDSGGLVPGAGRVKKYNSSGGILTQFGTYGTGAGQFLAVSGMGVDAAGDVFLADPANFRVEKYHP